jgi:hypothetical protein
VAPAVRDREAAERRAAAIRKYTPEMLRKKFPSWRYHRTAPAIIVHSPEEEAALGEGWADTPAAFRLFSMNMSLAKTFTIREGFFFDLTGNATNALNHPSFGQPDQLIGPGRIGNITSTRVPSRQIEIVFKLRF